MTEQSEQSATALVLHEMSTQPQMEPDSDSVISVMIPFSDDWVEGVKNETQQLENSMTKMFQFLKMDKTMHPTNMKKVERACDKFVSVCKHWKEALLQPEGFGDSQCTSSSSTLAICPNETEAICQKIKKEPAESMLVPYEAFNRHDTGCNVLVSANGNWGAKLEKETQQLENRMTKMFEFLKADKKMHPKNMKKLHRNEDKFLNVCSSLKDAFLSLPETNDVLQNQLINSEDSATQDICTYEAEDIKAFISQIHREREYYRSENCKVERKYLALLTKMKELSQQLKERGTNRFFKRGLRTPSTTVSTSSFDDESSIEEFSRDYSVVKLKMECEERLVAAEAVHTSLEDQIRLLKSQVDILTTENEDLHALSAKQDRNELKLIKILEEERSVDNSHKQRLRTLEDELDKRQELLIEKESELMSKERKLRKQEVDAKRLQKHSMMADLVEENSQLKYNIETLKREVTTKMPQHHTMMGDVFDHNSKLQQQVVSLEKQLFNYHMKSKNITEDLIEENTKLKEKVTILEKEASDGVLMSDDYAKLVEKSDNLERLFDESERNNFKLKEELETVKVRRDKFREVIITVKALEKQLADQKLETSRLWKITETKVSSSSNQNEVKSDHETKIDNNGVDGKNSNSTVATEASEDAISPTQHGPHSSSWILGWDILLFTSLYVMFMYFVYCLVLNELLP